MQTSNSRLLINISLASRASSRLPTFDF